MKRQRLQLRLLNRQVELDVVARHPGHEDVYETLTCPICRRRLDEARAALRRLPPIGRPA